MDSNFQVKVSADISELYKSIKQVSDAMSKLDGVTRDVGKAADTAASSMGAKLSSATKEMSKDAATASVSIGNLNKTFQESNDKAGRARLAAFAFGQVIRDAGFFSQSFGLGLLAISNNIPILIDQLVLLSGVSAGVGTALSLIGSIITAGLTVWAYSSNAVDKNKQSIDEWRRSLDDSTEAQLKGRQAALDEVVSLDVLYKATTDVSNSYKTRVQAAKLLQEQYPTTLGNLSQEAIMAGKAASAYNALRDSIIDAAMAEAAKDKIVENATRILDNNTKISQTQIALQKKKLALLQEELKYNKEFEAAAKSMAATAGKEGVDPFAAANRSLANQAALKKEIAALEKVIANATTDTTILNERNTSLTGEIAKNTDAYVARLSDGGAKSGLSNVEEILKKLKDTVTALNLDPTLSQLDKIKGKIDAYQSALKSLIAEGLDPNSKAVKNITTELSALSDQYKNLLSDQEILKKQNQYLEDTDKILASLAGKKVDIYSGVDTKKSSQLKQDIEATSDALNKLQALAAANPNLTGLNGINEQITALKSNLSGLKNSYADAVNTEEAEKKLVAFATGVANIFESGLVQGISSTMQGIGEAIASGGNVASAAGNALLTTLGNVLAQLGELAIGVGIGITAIKKALQSLNPFVAIAAGVALLTLAGFVKGKAKSLGGGGSGGGGDQKAPDTNFGSVRAFASGGIISGPTNALMGEYPGAKSNPEVVAPLDKLQGIIAGSVGGGGNMGGSLETRISGNDLVILMDRASKNRKNYF